MQPSILLVSDNALTRKTVRSALTPKGYGLIEVADAQSALAQLEAVRPALVLQDLVLPDVEQFGLAAALRIRVGDSVPILAFVGFTSKLDEARMASAGFNDTITKPIEAGRFLQMVEAYLPERVPNVDRFGVGKRLVLADDDPIQLKLMRFRLERLGFQVAVAGDGAQALLLAQQQPPDAMIADIMMPRLDGFALSLAVRKEPSLRHVPVILVTASYIEDSDRELARHAGANELVLHTPDLKVLIEALREALAHPVVARSLGGQMLVEFEHEHERRVVRQLERQVLLNAGLTQRCSALAAELRVLTGISENVLKRRDLDPAIDEALVACFDAGGIAMGALYLLRPDDRFKVRTVGAECRWTHEQLRTFFGHAGLLRQIIDAGESVSVPSDAVDQSVGHELLTACQVGTMLIVPLIYLDKPMGALMMAGATRAADPDDLLAFAEGLGAQITQVLALASAFAKESRARDAAEQQAALLNALLLHAPDCVAHLSPSGRILFVNNVMRETHPEMTVGRAWLAEQRPDHRELAQHAFDVVVSTGEPMSYETASSSPDGHVRWSSNRLGPVRRDGQIIGAMLVARDISDQKQAEAQLLVSDRMASVGMLAASVAHEINNPLAAMMINLELMGRDLKSSSGVAGVERLQKELEGAQEGGRRVTQVVRDLKIFSRSHETITRVHVRGVLESSLRMAWNEIRHRARLETTYGDIPAVDGDESRLGQVFLNLIINAAQAIPEGNAERNTLRVTTGLDDRGRVLVTVADSGSGIPEQNRAKLFRPFFTTKPEGVGTGLGLSICDRIVRSMGGEIGYETEVGQGTKFWVALPPSARAKIPSVHPPAPESVRPNRSGRVLIVEDDRLVGDVVKRFLGRDHDVRMVTRGCDALELIETDPCYDVILCDLMMPQMTGQELFAELLRVQPQQAERMVFMTAGPFTRTAREFLGSVGNHRIEKPFDLQALRQLFSELVH
jgi:PAS domain S-box-containing protein